MVVYCFPFGDGAKLRILLQHFMGELFMHKMHKSTDVTLAYPASDTSSTFLKTCAKYKIAMHKI